MSELALKLARVDELKRQLEAIRPLPREVEERILQKFRLWWTFHSNALEGNALTLGETETFLMEGLTAKGKPLKDHLDIRGHHAAIDYLLEFIRKKETLTEAVIRELHKIILVEDHHVEAETPEGQPARKLIRVGEYKTEPNSRRTVTGERRFYASPIETPARMRDLIAAYREDCTKVGRHIVETAARFHHEFTAIHPFDDGNGRMTRLLTNLILMQSGYPPIVIRTGERNAYILALSKGDQGDLEEITALVTDHLIEAMELYLRGARGEEIAEPSDVDKEIALLKREMQHIEAARPRDPTNTRRIVEKQVLPAWDRVGPRLASLGELFAETKVNISVSWAKSGLSSGNGIEKNLPGSVSLREIEGNMLPDAWFQQIQFHVLLRGFTRAGTQPFDVAAQFTWQFGELKYVFSTSLSDRPNSIERIYNEEIPSDELAKAMDAFCSYFVEEVRKQANGKK